MQGATSTRDASAHMRNGIPKAKTVSNDASVCRMLRALASAQGNNKTSHPSAATADEEPPAERSDRCTGHFSALLDAQAIRAGEAKKQKQTANTSSRQLQALSDTKSAPKSKASLPSAFSDACSLFRGGAQIDVLALSPQRSKKRRVSAGPRAKDADRKVNPSLSQAETKGDGARAIAVGKATMTSRVDPNTREGGAPNKVKVAKQQPESKPENSNNSSEPAGERKQKQQASSRTDQPAGQKQKSTKSSHSKGKGKGKRRSKELDRLLNMDMSEMSGFHGWREIKEGHVEEDGGGGRKRPRRRRRSTESTAQPAQASDPATDEGAAGVPKPEAAAPAAAKAPPTPSAPTSSAASSGQGKGPKKHPMHTFGEGYSWMRNPISASDTITPQPGEAAKPKRKSNKRSQGKRVKLVGGKKMYELSTMGGPQTIYTMLRIGIDTFVKKLAANYAEAGEGDDVHADTVQSNAQHWA